MCRLTADDCFHKYVIANERTAGIKEATGGWWSMPCPGRKHGPPLRLRVGDSFHIFYHDLGKCPDADVFGALIKLGMPGECLKRPKGTKQQAAKPDPVEPAHRTYGEIDGRLANTVLDIAFGEGTATERLIRIAMLAADGELPEGPIVDVFAANLRVSSASIYRATSGGRPKNYLSNP